MVDVFTQLTQCFDVVSKLECPDPEIWKRYMKRFAKTIVKVLTTYADIEKREFTDYFTDERIVSFCVCFVSKIFIPNLFIFFKGLYTDEQYPTVTDSVTKTIRIDGW